VIDGTLPILIYDGDCSLCTASARWLSAHSKQPARALDGQQLDAAELRQLGLTLDDVGQAAWWIDKSGRRSGGHLAIARALAATDGWRSASGKALLTPPLRWIAAGLYPLVARLRR
jgi:predicted DCC family thiol-disulfide oxidoreductase YuxK